MRTTRPILTASLSLGLLAAANAVVLAQDETATDASQVFSGWIEPGPAVSGGNFADDHRR